MATAAVQNHNSCNCTATGCGSSVNRSGRKPAKWALYSQLLLALQDCDVLAAAALFRQGVDTDTSFTIGSVRRPALCISAANNDVDMVRLMLRLGASVNQCDSSSRNTPLLIAFEAGHVVLARELLYAKANPWIKNSSGQTPLHLAAKRGSIELVDLLLESGIPLGSDAKDCHLQTPLHLAAQAGAADVVQRLVEAGADPRCRDGSGDTPLHLAVNAMDDPVNVISILMHAYPQGALEQNVIKKTPLHSIITGTQRPEESLAIMLRLIPIGCGGPPTTLSPRGCFGHTPLHLAVLERRFNLAKMLIAAGSELDTRDQLGRTPLDCAVRDNCTPMVELLLAAGASCRRSSSSSNHTTQEINRDPTIEKLLMQGRSSPLSLASHCRRSLARSIGPKLQQHLDERFPKSWRTFLSYKDL